MIIEEVEKKIGELYAAVVGGWGESKGEITIAGRKEKKRKKRKGKGDINIAGRGAAVRKLPLGVTNSNVGIRRRYQKGNVYQTILTS